MWFRSYIVDAALHTPLHGKYIYVELANPLDSVVSQALIGPDNGIYHGYLSLAKELPDGDYTLRAYSRYMLKNGNECIFRRPDRVISISWNKVNMRALSERDGKTQNMTLTFASGDKPLQLCRADMSVKNKPAVKLELTEMKDGVEVKWGKNDWKSNSSWLLSMKDTVGNSYSRFLPVSTRNEDY